MVGTRVRCPKCDGGQQKTRHRNLFAVYVGKKHIQLVCGFCGWCDYVRGYEKVKI